MKSLPLEVMESPLRTWLLGPRSSSLRALVLQKVGPVVSRSP